MSTLDTEVRDPAHGRSKLCVVVYRVKKALEVNCVTGDAKQKTRNYKGKLHRLKMRSTQDTRALLSQKTSITGL
jgi:hypothetical protein